VSEECLKDGFEGWTELYRNPDRQKLKDARVNSTQKALDELKRMKAASVNN
jgi:hypothetical protein